jgi:hypothetical protein
VTDALAADLLVSSDDSDVEKVSDVHNKPPTYVHFTA